MFGHYGTRVCQCSGTICDVSYRARTETYQGRVSIFLGFTKGF